MISLNNIPITLRTPGQYIEFDNSRAIRGLPALVHKVLVLGQCLPSGAVQAGIPTRVVSIADAERDFGRGSQLAAMLAAVITANRWVDVTAVALDDAAAGTAATGTITVAGPASAAGTLVTYIGGKRVAIAVASASSANAIATALAAAINADTTLPVTAAAAAGVVTLTARHKGIIGNQVDLRANYAQGDIYPDGVGLTFVPMAGGAGNPEVDEALAALGDIHYATLVLPFTDATTLDVVEANLEERWGPMQQREAVAFAAVPGTFSDMTTLGESRNDQLLVVMGAGKSPTPPYIWAAVTAAVDAGEPDPARPRQTLALPGVLPPAVQDRLAQPERNLLLYSGVSTYTVDAGGDVRIERLITTYRESANGTPDESYLDIETVRTLGYMRAAFRSRIALTFPRHKLANDDTNFAPGQAIATPKLIKVELLHVARQLEQAGILESFEQFKAEMIVERDANDHNRVNALLPPDTVNQLRVFAAAVQFIK